MKSNEKEVEKIKSKLIEAINLLGEAQLLEYCSTYKGIMENATITIDIALEQLRILQGLNRP